MIKKIKLLAASLALSLGMLTPVALVSTVGAQSIQDSLCGGVNLGDAGEAGSCSDDSSGTNVNTIVEDVVNFLSWFVGIVSVIMIIVGGFRYITSGGSNDKVTSAKNTIVYAIIGLILVALAQFIVNFVIARVTTTGS
jgi:hypothetical protein